MKLDKLLLLMLLLLLITYFSQGIFFPRGSFISQFSLFFIFAISVKYFIRLLLIKKKKPMFFYVLTILFVLNLFSYLFTADLSSGLHFGKLKGLLLVILPFYSFYYLSSIDVLKVKHLRMFFLLVLVIAIMQFYIERETVLAQRTWNSDNVVNNIAYLFVFLIPYLFLFKKKMVTTLLSLILMFYIIQGAKRGALIAGLVGIITLTIYQFRNIKNKNKGLNFIFTFLLIFFLFCSLYSFYLNNEYLVKRMSSISDGGYSGRDIIYLNIFYSWYYNSSLLKTLFGFGFGSALELSGSGHWAHNDWLEGLASLGLLGVGLYFLLFIALSKLVFSKVLFKDKRIAMFTITTIWFLTSLVSMYFYNATYSVFQNIVLAFLIGSKKNSIE